MDSVGTSVGDVVYYVYRAGEGAEQDESYYGSLHEYEVGEVLREYQAGKQQRVLHPLMGAGNLD